VHRANAFERAFLESDDAPLQHFEAFHGIDDVGDEDAVYFAAQDESPAPAARTPDESALRQTVHHLAQILARYLQFSMQAGRGKLFPVVGRGFADFIIPCAILGNIDAGF
jgi:hypothetical protein